ncbi:MAG: TIGR00730 family Rossman fold protein [Ruminococcaceae bacterium]|nr:TIGR00730 family Rossman fold protein [Oscillospiraceae bacterium]
MRKRKYVCVYGGANEKIENIHKDELYKLGKIINECGFSLIYGAGATGCMGAIARGVKENGGFVLGISPTFMKTYEEIFPCSKTVLVKTMSKRKDIMEKFADIFIVAPGGVGTMDEFFQIITLKYLNRISNPIILLNLNGFYDSLITFIEDLIKQGAVINEVFSLFDIATSIDDKKLLKYLKN